MSEPADGRMTPSGWRRVARLFDDASGLGPEERQALLERRCAGDPELRREVESLLAADEKAPEFLDLGAAELVASDDTPDEGVEGERLGVYRLIREIGRGGMSRVYLAERVGDELRRRVAIKRLASPGWQREERLQRFRAEGLVLANLSHPHVAQVYDAGVDEVGDPYLVMEHVDGMSITDSCAARDLRIDERIRLFLDVCGAVQHAHQRLIVHRDLKPSNILVDREGRVKLLDFGIAKLLEPSGWDLEDDHPPTRTGFLPMTPEYAAPEQIKGREITTATDVYGLGLVLYELLSGHRPFDLRGLPASEIERIVCEEEPRKPSLDGSREPSEELSGDLDAIVLRSLAKEPERRYGSARELAEDLRRYLEGLPVTARAASVRYRLGRFLRRHRTAVVSGTAAALLLTGLAGFHTIRLQEERDHAQHEARRAEEITALLRHVFWEADPRQGPEGFLTVDEILARAARRIDHLDTDPLVQAELLHFLALAHFGRGRPGEAEPLFERSLEIRRTHLVPPDPKLTRSLNHLGWLYLTRQEAAAAEESFVEGLEAHRGWPGGPTEDLADALRGLGLARSAQSDHGEAVRLIRRAIATMEGLQGVEPAHVADAYQDLGIVLRDMERFPDSRAALQKSLQIRRSHFADGHPAIATSLHQLALLEFDEGNLERSEALLDRSLTIRRRALGEDHPSTEETRAELRELQTHSETEGKQGAAPPPTNLSSSPP